MAGTSVKSRFGFCDADVKAAPSLHFHHHRWHLSMRNQSSGAAPTSASARIPPTIASDGMLLCAKTCLMRAEQARVSNWANLESELFSQLLIVDETCVRILVLCIDTIYK